MSQSLLLVLLGGAVLRITVLSSTYVNYVKPVYRPILIVAGAVVLVLGIIGLVQEWRKPLLTEESHEHDHVPAAESQEDDHGHDHSRIPRVAWLLALPVFAIFLIAPPALGAFAARSEEPPPPPTRAVIDAYHPLTAPITEMTLGEFVGRAWEDSKRTLAGKTVRLVGFVVPSTKQKDRWYVARMQISCCAADAIALKIAVLGAAEPPENQWVEVTGTWIAPKSSKIPNGTVAPELTATQVTRIPQPSEPYE